MKNIIRLNLGGIIAFIIMAGIVYNILLYDFFIPTSIESLLDIGSDHPSYIRCLVLVSLPIYIAFIIFGAGVISYYLGTTLQNFFDYLSRNN